MMYYDICDILIILIAVFVILAYPCVWLWFPFTMIVYMHESVGANDEAGLAA